VVPAITSPQALNPTSIAGSEDLKYNNGHGTHCGSSSHRDCARPGVRGELQRARSHDETDNLKKYTLEPTGIWAWIHRRLAVDPTRSTGIPLNPQFRNPPPGANDPMAYDDPVTLPAADIADNPYWKRDVRRSYAPPSAVSQGDVVALLSVGSKANPKDGALKIGNAGKQQLVALQEEGNTKGLATLLAQEKNLGKEFLGKGGLPPNPVPFERNDVKQYKLLRDQTYGDE
jgi:hypothetical protein